MKELDLGRYARCAGESDNPSLWDGLAGAWVPALGCQGGRLVDVSGRGRHMTGVTYTWGPNSINVSGGGKFSCASYGYNSPRTLVAWFNQINVTGTQYIFGDFANDALSLGTGIYTSSAEIFAQSVVTSTFNGLKGNIGTGKHAVVAASPSDGNMSYLYMDGVMLSSIRVEPASSRPDTTGKYIGNRGNNDRTFSGDVYLALDYTRVLIVSEALLLSADPLAPFRRRKPSILYSFPASKFIPHIFGRVA